MSKDIIINNDDKVLSFMPLSIDNKHKNNPSSFYETNSPEKQIGKNVKRTIDKCGIRLKYMK